jgi:hypothetical protein
MCERITAYTKQCAIADVYCGVFCFFLCSRLVEYDVSKGCIEIDGIRVSHYMQFVYIL